MKKLVLNSFLIAGVLFAANATAQQTFTLPADTVSMTMSGSEKMYNDITNIADSSIYVSWTVAEHDFPADWGKFLGICDNITCYTNIGNSLLRGDTQTTAEIVKGTTATFYVLPDLTDAASGTHYIKIRMMNGSYTKDSWYIVSKFSTGVVSVSRSDAKIITFPNPASTELTVVHDAKMGVKNIVVSGLNGQQVASHKASDRDTKIDVSGLVPGVYVIQLLNNEGRVAGSTQFVRK